MKVQSYNQITRIAFRIFILMVLSMPVHGALIESDDWKSRGQPLGEHFDTMPISANPQNYRIKQDQKGYIYVANGAGLLIFDGKDWQVLSKGDQQLYLDFDLNEDGRIYTGAAGDLGYYEADKKGNWTFYSLIGGKNTPEFSYVLRVLSVGRHVLYITRNHLFHFHPDDGLSWAERRFSPRSILFNGEKVLISSFKGKMFGYSLDDKSLKELNNFSHPDEPTFYKMLFLKEKSLLLSDRQKLYITDNTGLKRLHTEVDDWLADKLIQDVVLSSENEIIIATRSFGLVVINLEGELIRFYNVNNGLSSNLVNALLVDNEKNIWVAYATDGISRTELNSSLSLFSNKKNLALSASTIEFKNQIFVGGLAGLFKLQQIKNKNEKVEFVKVSHDIKLVLSFLIDEDMLLIGHEVGVDTLEINEKGEMLFSNIHDSSNNNGRFINSLIRSNQNPEIVYAICINGLIKLVKKDGQWHSHGFASNFEKNLSSIYQEDLGDLWLGTIKGEFFKVSELEKWPDVKTEAANSPLPKRATKAKVFGLGSTLLFSNSLEENIQTTSLSSKVFTSSTVASWEKNNITHIQALQQSDNGKAWFATRDKGSGVNRIGSLNLNSQGRYDIDFSQLDRLKLEFLESLYLGSNGDLWINSREHIFRYRTKRPDSKLKLQPPTLTRAIELGSGRNLFNNTNFTINTPEIELTAEENAINLHFSAVNYRNRHTLEYRYRLINHQDSWSEWNKKSFAEFTNLEPGDFLFELQYRTNTTNFSPTAQVELRRLPYWYQIIWVKALALMALLISFISFAVFYARLRNRRITQQALALENQVVERTAIIRQQNRKLCELDEAKNRFFANVSHEFRTPLALAIGPLKELNASKHIGNPQDREYLDIALTNSLHMMELVGQILDINRLEASRMPLKISRINLTARLKYCVQRFHLQKQKTLFKLVNFENDIFIYFDSDHFEKIILNLISNAIKFSPSNSIIEIGIKLFEKKASIWVKDQGSGISTEDQRHIFDRYYQGLTSSHTLQPGTGIGLALVKELLSLHQGEVAVDSHPGGGSKFTITLLTDGQHYDSEVLVDSKTTEENQTFSKKTDEVLPAEVTKNEAPETAKENRKNILIVDDNPDLRRFIRTLLQSVYNISESDNGVLAYQQAIENQPDVIVCDIMMPVMDGLELAKKLKSTTETAHIPLVLLTAKSTKREVVEGLQQGADDYLSKPFDSAELAARIAAQINQKQHIADDLFRKFNKQIDISEQSLDEVDKFTLRLNILFNEKLGDPEFDVEQMCSLMSTSRSTLFRQVKKRFDCTPIQLLRIRRLKLSLQMLKSHSGTVSEVAYAVGFQSLSAFSRAFSEQYKISPTRSNDVLNKL